MATELEIPQWVAECVADLKTDIFWITGGIGAAKTTGSALWFIERAYRNHKSPLGWTVAPTHTKSRDILVPTFEDVLKNHYGLKLGKHFDITISAPPILKLKEIGQEIHFHSGNKPNLMVGSNIWGYLTTESGLLSKAVFERCEDRKRCNKAAVLQAMCEGTPEGLLTGWSEWANIGEYSDDGTHRRIQLHTSDNKHLPKGYFEKIVKRYSYDQAKVRSYVYGEFAQFTRGTAYWEFFGSRNIVHDVPVSPHLTLAVCFDFNKAPLTWVLIQRQPVELPFGQRYFRWIALKETAGKSRGLLDAAAEIVAKLPVHIYGDTPLELYGDPSGFFGSHKASHCDFERLAEHLRKYFRNVTIKADRKAPDISARLERVNHLLAFERFMISSECPALIRSLSMTSLKPGTWEILKPKDEDWTHPGDAVGYPLYQLTKESDFDSLDKPRVYGTSA